MSSFSAQLKKANKEIANPKSDKNQLFLVGVRAVPRLREGFAHSHDKSLICAVGNEEVICKIENKTTVGELTFDGTLYSSVRPMAGVLAKSGISKMSKFTEQ